MNITDTKHIETDGVNAFDLANVDGKNALIISVKEKFLQRAQYTKALKQQWTKFHELDHPHLMKMTALDESTDAGARIVLETEPVRTLREYMAENHSEEERLDIVEQLADVLSFLHGRGIVHGLLHPNVVFVTNQGNQVRLVCFREVFTDALLEGSRVARYQAPEAEDGTVGLDARSDIYSLGQIMKDLHLQTSYQHVIDKCTGFGRSERYLDIDAFLAALNHGYSSTSSNKGLPKAVIGIVALFIVLAVGYVVAEKLGHSGGDGAAATEQTTDANADSTATDGENAVNSAASTSGTQNANTPAAGSSSTQAGSYSGDLAFLNTLVPQMHTDLEKIYQPLTQPDLTVEAKAQLTVVVKKKLRAYYKGLRRSLGALSDAKSAAFDKEYADYVAKKNKELGI